MNYNQRLSARIQSVNNNICMGMDPVLDRIPLEGSDEYKVEKFYMDILEQFQLKGIFPAAVKPNSAYYECISFDAMRVLGKLIEAYSEAGVMIVLDSKRGDIGKSSAAYAKAAFSVYKADSITVSPYMGEDCVKPFVDFDSSKGVYGLLRTSNKGARDFQDLNCDGTSLFYSVGKKYIEWTQGNLGAVVGATNVEELENISRFFAERNAEIPFLIPGLSVKGVPGQQGGSIKDTMQAIVNGGGNPSIHLLNSSSGLNYAYQAKPDLNYDVACVTALEELATEANL